MNLPAPSEPIRALLRAVVSQVDEVVVEFDAGGMAVAIWTGNEALFPLGGDDLAGRPVEDLVGEGTGRRFREAITRAVAGEEVTLDYEVELAGVPHTFAGRFSRYDVDPAAGPRVLLYTRDVTETRRSGDALRRSERSARQLFELNPLPMWVWDPQTFAFLDVNEAAERQYGYTRDEFLAMGALDIRPPEERERLHREVTHDDTMKHYGLWRHLRKDGTELKAEIWSTLIPWADDEARLSISLDVTDRVRAERALRDAEARYRSLVETLPAAVYLARVDADFTSSYVSPQIEELIGHTPEDFERDPQLWRKIIHPDDLERVLEWSRGRYQRKQRYDDEYRMIARDGSVVWLRDVGVPIPDASGVLTYWQGFLTDITERKLAELRLHEAQQRSRLILDNISDLVALIDLDGIITYASPSHEEVLGVPLHELVGEIAWARVPADAREVSVREFERALRGERAAALRFRLVDAEGEVHEMEGSGWQPLFGDDGAVSAVLAVSRDVTERVRVEQERRQMLARLVAAGEEERRRIADDVHDAPIQSLTALGIRLETLRPKIVDEEGAAQLDRIAEGVGETIGSLRSLMFDLRPPVLDRGGLVPALCDHLAGLAEDAESPLAFEIHDRITRQPRHETRIVLYRIAQEALVNVRKHAAASRVDISVETVDGGTRLRIEDDGRGLPRNAESRRGHVGISAMRERAASVGGRFSIAPRPRGGTLVEAWVPDAPAR